MIRRFAVLTLLGAAILALGVGCGGAGSKVEVLVTLDGQPLEGASVTFNSDKGTPYAGMTDAAGKCTLIGPTKEGVPPGDYGVTISKFEAMKGGCKR